MINYCIKYTLGKPKVNTVNEKENNFSFMKVHSSICSDKRACDGCYISN